MARRASRQLKFAAFVAALYGFLLVSMIVGMARDGGGPTAWVAIAIGIIAAAPLLLAWGVWILSNPEALAEDTRRDSYTGKKTSGPIAAKGLVLTTLGALIYAFPAIGWGYQAFAPRKQVPTPSTASTPRTPKPPMAKPKEPTSLASPRRSPRQRTNGRWPTTRAPTSYSMTSSSRRTRPRSRSPSRTVRARRGKRTCATGVIGDIERKDLDQRDIYAGTLATAEGDTVAFLAVGSTGTLVRRSAATLCGVVLGTTERRVMLVGMFDLPENKQRAVER